MAMLLDDVRHALQSLRRQPRFAAAAILMLTLGIGATAAVFSVVKAVLIDPLPYPNSHALVRIVHNIGGIEQSYFNDAIITTYTENGQAFESLGVWVPSGAGATITGEGNPEEVRSLTASRGFLTTLGVQPETGRWFSREDDAPGSANTVILGGGYWRRKFGSDPAVVGRTIVIDARPHQIIGVMPAHFTFDGEFDVLLPLRIDATRLVPFFRLNGVARLKPGVTLATGNADIARMLEIYFEKFRVNTARAVRWTPSLVPLKQDVIGDVGATLWTLMATVAVVLLMACANVANLMLLRTESRRHEFAIRMALGAKWTRVTRALAIESMILAMVSGLLGLALAYGGLQLLVALAPGNLPRLSEVAIDGGAVLVAAAISLAAGPLLAVTPIAKLAGGRFSTAIGGSARGTTLTYERQRTQNMLVAAQIALAVLLLVSSGLLIRSYQALRRVEPGFAQPRTLQTVGITIPAAVVPDLERLTRTQQAILDSIARIPGVTSTAFTTRLPMDPSDRWSAALSAADRPDDPGVTPPNRQVKVVSPGSFESFGTPLVAGRDFTWADLYELREVAIVSENLAREIWGSADGALGKRIRQFYGTKGPWREIIGVAGDVFDDGVHEAPPATVYFPARLEARLFAGYQPRRVSIVIRTERAGTSSLLEEVRQAVWAVNPDLPLAQPVTLERLYTRSMSRSSVTLLMLAIASAIALLLGIGGIYGVIAYSVTQRRREIGIRMALGAQAHQVRALFLRRGMILTAAGLLLGLTTAALVTRLLQSLLFGIEPIDPITFAATPILLTAAALLATYLPARRALLVDPLETIRAE